MINFKFFHLLIILLILVFIIIFIIYKNQKRFKNNKDLVTNSFIDALTFNAGLTILLYLVGSFFSINFLSDIDNYALYTALLLSGFIMLADVIDKIKKKNK